MTLQFYCLGLMAIDMFFQLGNVQIHPLENSLSPPTMITEIPLQVVPLKDIASVIIKKQRQYLPLFPTLRDEVESLRQ